MIRCNKLASKKEVLLAIDIKVLVDTIHLSLKSKQQQTLYCGRCCGEQLLLLVWIESFICSRKKLVKNFVRKENRITDKRAG